MRNIWRDLSDPRAMFVENDNQGFARAEIICPQPHRAARIPVFIEGVDKYSSRSKSIFNNLSKQKEGSSLEFLDILLNKDYLDDDLDGSTQMEFFCCSPPVRSHNPVVHDAQFTKQSISIVPPLANSFEVENSSASVDRRSPSCGSFSGSPKIRVEGFTCRNFDSCPIVPSLA